MSLVEGRTIWDGGLPGMPPAERTATYHALIDTLAALHNVDYQAAGLGDYGRPGNYFERQVGRWTKQYRGAETETIDAMESLMEWLPRTLPTQDRTSIVHGDYRIDNVIFDAAEPKIRAVLDWELSTLGDPLADLSYMLMNWVTVPEGRSGVSGLTGSETGIPTIEDMVDRYCAATGRDGIPDLNWYFAFGLFRLAGIVQGIKKRVIDGTASSAHAAEMATRVPRLAESAWSFALKAGA
jgi:aminoglycoside phosphotransferase (APT) family kinase protein